MSMASTCILSTLIACLDPSDPDDRRFLIPPLNVCGADALVVDDPITPQADCMVYLFVYSFLCFLFC